MEECCGMHEVCEKTLTERLPETLYYDDEELDAYRGVPATAHTPDAVAQFEEVLTTMRPEEVSEWLVALQKRELELPAVLRDVAFMLMEGR